MLRIVLLLVVAWMTLLIFNSALIVVPISLGRALFNGIPLLPITHGIKCNGNVVDELVLQSFLSCLLNENVDLFYASFFFFFLRFIFFHHWKLCHLDCSSWSQVFH